MLLEGKKGLIYGVRNERSIAWGCAVALAREGAKFALSVYSEREEKDAEKLAQSLPAGACAFIQRCDMTDEAQLATLHARVKEEMGSLDFMAHVVAFGKELGGRFIDTSKEAFDISLTSSVYTFISAARHAEPLLNQGGSMITLSYLGGERVVPAYNVMGVAKAALESSVRYLANDLGPNGVRVNAISAGPTMTLSARGISGFTDLYRSVPDKAPLRHNTTIDEVGDTCVYLVSDLSRGMTGDVIFVDSGMHALACF
ncbi:MAG TPA: enoyl-ACP reductase [Capsulimonadaceae bacterium]|nr:enoyl-ACP reductase [Capsulimonadaceae bacterium]